MQRREIPTAFLQRLGDSGYSLPDENPATATLDQARRWAQTYDELIDFKRELLDLCHRYTERSEPHLARAIHEADVVLLETQLSRFEQRRDYWKIRAAEMHGGRSRGAD